MSPCWCYTSRLKAGCPSIYRNRGEAMCGGSGIFFEYTDDFTQNKFSPEKNIPISKKKSLRIISPLFYENSPRGSPNRRILHRNVLFYEIYFRKISPLLPYENTPQVNSHTESFMLLYDQ